MGGTSSNTVSEKVAGIRVQSSAYGAAKPWVFGRARVSANLLWYGSFKAVPVTQEQGGKGGATITNTSWAYQAACILGACLGPVNGIPRAWVGKQLFAGEPVSVRIVTLEHTVTAASGVPVTVPSAALWFGNIEVLVQEEGANDAGTFTRDVLLTQGVHYTVAAGVYTWNMAEYAFAGWPVRMRYQVQETVAATSALAQLGLNLATGLQEQPVWPWLQSNYAAQALGYSGLAYLYAEAYALDDAASLPNHNFEISTASEIGAVSGVAEPVVDAAPENIVRHWLTHPVAGVGWGGERVASLERYAAYCRALGLWFSPAMTEQRPATDYLRQLLRLTNSVATWWGGVLDVVPLGDADITAHGATFTADVTPLYDLDESDFFPDEGEPPVVMRRHQAMAAEADAAMAEDVGYNIFTLEYENRENGYAQESVTHRDLAHIERFGKRPAETIKAPEIKTTAVARQVAALLAQQALAKLNEYEFNVSWRHAFMRPARLVRITEPSLGLNLYPVRIKRITELDDERFAILAEDAAIGSANAPQYPSQAGAGFQVDHAVAPGNAHAPVIFELPAALTTTGLELAVASSGGPYWGGAHVWVSYDGTQYTQIGTLRGGSRYGALASPIASGVLTVDMVAGQLLPASAADAAALATLCYVGGATPEYLAYQGASLSAPATYALGGLVRGAYGTSGASAHSAADPFVRVDSAVARTGALDTALIGTTVYIKLTSFNVFDLAPQGLDEVSATAYVITGSMVQAIPGVGGRGVNLKASSLTFQYPKAGGVNPSSVTLTAERKGALQGAVSWSVVSGTATLAGTGDVRTIAPGSMSSDAVTVRASVTDDVATYTAEVTIVKVREGADGDPGDPGTSYYTATVYKQAGSAPAAPSGGSFSFSTGVLTPPSGWTVAAPSVSTTPTYAAEYLFATATPGATVTGGTYSTPVVDAVAGGPGNDGESVLVMEVYLQASSPPSAPSGGSYNLSTGAFTPPAGGWSANMPASSITPTFRATYRFATNTPTVAVSAGTYTTPAKVAQDGAAGAAAVSSGADVAAIVLAADSLGVVNAGALPITITAWAKLGAADDTSNWTWSRSATSGITTTISGSAVTVTAVSSGLDSGTVTITGTKAGASNVTIVVPMSKAKASVPATGPRDFAGYTGAVRFATGTPAVAEMRLNSSGALERRMNGGSWTSVGVWHQGTVSGTFSAKATNVGSALSSGTLNAWLSLASSQVWAVSQPVISPAGEKNADLTFAIKDDATDLVVATGTWNLNAVYEA